MNRDDERRLAAALFNHVWSLLDTADRTTEQSDEMLHAAHASRHHWGRAGDAVNWARGEWQCSRVYAVLGRSEPALHHARRCLSLAEEHDLGPFDLGPFDLGAAHEALARAYLVAGDEAACARSLAAGRALAATVTDPEDKQILLTDLTDLSDLSGLSDLDELGPA